jgi:hypothetical protein
MSEDNVTTSISRRTMLLIVGATVVGIIAVALGLALYIGGATTKSDESAALAFVAKNAQKPTSAITKVSEAEFEAACAAQNTSAPHEGTNYYFYTGELYVIVYKEDGEWTGQGLQRGPRISP